MLSTTNLIANERQRRQESFTLLSEREDYTTESARLCFELLNFRVIPRSLTFIITMNNF